MDIEQLEQKILFHRAEVSESIEFLEPGMKLDLESRKNDEKRQFTHLHQMCTLHAENFAAANQIKTVALVDGYLENARAKSALGIYLFSRSILELAAFTFEVKSRLNAITLGPDHDWNAKGVSFFGNIVRGRFGTSNPVIAEKLIKLGSSKKNIVPFHIKDCLNHLCNNDAGRTLDEKYDFLCDFVHHNLSSQLTSSPGLRTGHSANSSNGGSIMSMGQTLISRYDYPVTSKATVAVEDTIEIVDQCLDICTNSINEMARTPYSETQIEIMTGSKIGFLQVPNQSFSQTSH